MLKLTQKNFDEFVDALNHRMTRIEGDVKWMRRIGYYMSGILTAILIKSFIYI